VIYFTLTALCNLWVAGEGSHERRAVLSYTQHHRRQRTSDRFTCTIDGLGIDVWGYTYDETWPGYGMLDIRLTLTIAPEASERAAQYADGERHAVALWDGDRYFGALTAYKWFMQWEMGSQTGRLVGWPA
jgi:hypothetical protein